MATASDPGDCPDDIVFFGEPLETVRVRGRLRRIADGEPFIYAGDWDYEVDDAIPTGEPLKHFWARWDAPAWSPTPPIVRDCRRV